MTLEEYIKSSHNIIKTVKLRSGLLVKAGIAFGDVILIESLVTDKEAGFIKDGLTRILCFKKANDTKLHFLSKINSEAEKIICGYLKRRHHLI